MAQTGKTITSEGAEARKWIGRTIMAVILGEAIWSLIVSVMNNLVVPWLGELMGPSSGVPTSFTQRPYDYPDLFVCVLEVGIAGLVVAILNYLIQRPGAERVKPLKSTVPAAGFEPARVVPQAVAARPDAAGIHSALTDTALSHTPLTHTPLPPTSVAPAPAVAPPGPVAEPDPVTPPAPVRAAPAPPSPSVTPAPVAKLLPVAQPTPPVVNSVAAKPLRPAAKAEPAKPKKPKDVYYNIVGEPIPSDED